MNLIQVKTLLKFISKLSVNYNKAGNLYLVGETSLLFEGWRNWIERIEIASEINPEHKPAFSEALKRTQDQFIVEVIDESPGDYIPLPDGYRERAIRAENTIYSNNGNFKQDDFKLLHFDPYSVAFRFIARGDEPDYHLTLAYLQHGWISIEKMESLLVNLLPQFTRETIQQDSAEFRRKFKGLLQMWRAVNTGAKHQPP